MDGGAQPGGSGNLLPHRDLVAHLYDWRAGRADVHGHGKSHLGGRLVKRFHRLAAGRFLPLVRVHAAIEGEFHRSTSQIKPLAGLAAVG